MVGSAKGMGEGSSPLYAHKECTLGFTCMFSIRPCSLCVGVDLIAVPAEYAPTRWTGPYGGKNNKGISIIM